MAKIEILRTREGKYRFLLKSRNGMKLLTGELLNSVAECERAIEVVRELFRDIANIRRRKTDGREPYFIIENEHVIATSRIYASEANLRESITPIKKNLTAAQIFYHNE